MRTHGGLIGVAIGDALGSTLEFMNAKEIKSKYGTHREITGGGWLNLKAGEVTDDTQMTLCVARGILNSPEDPVQQIGVEFEKWYRSNPKDIGGIISAAIGCHISSRLDWEDAAKKAHQLTGGRSAGNGALMRCIYPALYYKDNETAEAATAAQARMTHYDQQSTDACILYCRIIRGFLKLTNSYARTITKSWGRGIVKSECQGTPYEAIDLLTKQDLNPSGYVVDSMRCAIWAFLKGKNFEDVLVKAVNLGGDADTIGAIAGGLAGAWYGAQGIPERWKETLDPNTHTEILSLAGEALCSRTGKEA